MRTLGTEELIAIDVPFVRHHLDPATVTGAWTSGEAVVVEGGRRVAAADGRVITALGPERDLTPLLSAVAEVIEAPARLSLPLGAAGVLPPAWPLGPVHHWHWMLSRTPPPEPVGPIDVVEDAGEIDDLLDAVAPDSHARPGTPGIEGWWGVRGDAGRLLAVGAVIRQPDGTGHLRAVAVVEDARGRGLGRWLSAALTRRALEGAGVATLGVYVDNGCLRIYRGLGYAVTHSFTSGPVSASASTTASVPSR